MKFFYSFNFRFFSWWKCVLRIIILHLIIASSFSVFPISSSISLIPFFSQSVPPPPLPTFFYHSRSSSLPLLLFHRSTPIRPSSPVLVSKFPTPTFFYSSFSSFPYSSSSSPNDEFFFKSRRRSFRGIVSSSSVYHHRHHHFCFSSSASSHISKIKKLTSFTSPPLSTTILRRFSFRSPFSSLPSHMTEVKESAATVAKLWTEESSETRLMRRENGLESRESQSSEDSFDSPSWITTDLNRSIHASNAWAYEKPLSEHILDFREPRCRANETAVNELRERLPVQSFMNIHKSNQILIFQNNGDLEGLIEYTWKNFNKFDSKNFVAIFRCLGAIMKTAPYVQLPVFRGETGGVKEIVVFLNKGNTGGEGEGRQPQHDDELITRGERREGRGRGRGRGGEEEDREGGIGGDIWEKDDDDVESSDHMELKMRQQRNRAALSFDFLERLLQKLIDGLPKMGPAEISSCVWSLAVVFQRLEMYRRGHRSFFGRVTEKSGEFLHKLLQRCIDMASEFTLKELTWTLWGVTRCCCIAPASSSSSSFSSKEIKNDQETTTSSWFSSPSFSSYSPLVQSILLDFPIPSAVLHEMRSCLGKSFSISSSFLNDLVVFLSVYAAMMGHWAHRWTVAEMSTVPWAMSIVGASGLPAVKFMYLHLMEEFSDFSRLSSVFRRYDMMGRFLRSLVKTTQLGSSSSSSSSAISFIQVNENMQHQHQQDEQEQQESKSSTMIANLLDRFISVTEEWVLHERHFSNGPRPYVDDEQMMENEGNEVWERRSYSSRSRSSRRSSRSDNSNRDSHSNGIVNPFSFVEFCHRDVAHIFWALSKLGSRNPKLLSWVEQFLTLKKTFNDVRYNSPSQSSSSPYSSSSSSVHTSAWPLLSSPTSSSSASSSTSSFCSYGILVSDGLRDNELLSIISEAILWDNKTFILKICREVSDRLRRRLNQIPSVAAAEEEGGEKIIFNVKSQSYRWMKIKTKKSKLNVKKKVEESVESQIGMEKYGREMDDDEEEEEEEEEKKGDDGDAESEETEEEEEEEEKNKSYIYDDPDLVSMVASALGKAHLMKVSDFQEIKNLLVRYTLTVDFRNFTPMHISLITYGLCDALWDNEEAKNQYYSRICELFGPTIHLWEPRYLSLLAFSLARANYADPLLFNGIALALKQIRLPIDNEDSSPSSFYENEKRGGSYISQYSFRQLGSVLWAFAVTGIADESLTGVGGIFEQLGKYFAQCIKSEEWRLRREQNENVEIKECPTCHHKDWNYPPGLTISIFLNTYCRKLPHGGQHIIDAITSCPNLVEMFGLEPISHTLFALSLCVQKSQYYSSSSSEESLFPSFSSSSPSSPSFSSYSPSSSPSFSSSSSPSSPPPFSSSFSSPSSPPFSSSSSSSSSPSSSSVSLSSFHSLTFEKFNSKIKLTELPIEFLIACCKCIHKNLEQITNMSSIRSIGYLIRSLPYFILLLDFQFSKTQTSEALQNDLPSTTTSPISYHHPSSSSSDSSSSSSPSSSSSRSSSSSSSPSPSSSSSSSLPEMSSSSMVDEPSIPRELLETIDNLYQAFSLKILEVFPIFREDPPLVVKATEALAMMGTYATITDDCKRAIQALTSESIRLLNSASSLRTEDVENLSRVFEIIKTLNLKYVPFVDSSSSSSFSSSLKEEDIGGVEMD